MGSGRAPRRGERLLLLKVGVVLVTCFAAGLMSAGVVAGAGPLAALSSDTETTGTETTGTDTTTTSEPDTTDTEPSQTDSTDTTTTEAAPSGACAPVGGESLATDAPDYAPGSVVQITGSGFAADCDVELRITRPDAVVETFRTSTDDAGELLHEYLLPPPPGVIGEYVIDAIGLDGVALATFAFGDSRAVQAAALDGQASVTVLPSATIPAQVRVLHNSAGSTDNDWRSTGWAIGPTSGCGEHTDETSSGTDEKSFNVTAPASPGTYNVTFRAFINDGCTGTEVSDVTLTLSNGVVVDDTILFTDRFGTNASLNSVPGWSDGDGGSDDCAVRAITPGSGPTSGFNNGYLRVRSGCTTTRSGISTVGKANIHFRYMWGQDTDNDGTDDGDLVVQWKRSADSTWLTVNTHDLPNNTDTDPTTAVDALLPASASNSSIDIRIWGNTPEDNDQGRVDNVIVTGTAAPTNTPPVAVDDSYTTNEDTNLVLDAVASGPNASPVDNDTDGEGNTLTVTAVTGATGGTVTLASGTITFDPADNVCEPGNYGFDYTVSDGNGGTDTGHADVTITCVDDPPLAVDDTYTTNEDTNLVLDATAAGPNASPVDNDTDVDGNTLTVTAVTGPAGGTVTLASGTITFDPADNVCEPGTYGFDYTVSDGSGGSDDGHVDVTISCVNDAPVCAARSITTDQDTAGSVAPACTDVDDPVSSLTYAVMQPTKGVAGFSASNLTFDPDGEFDGLDTTEQDTTNGDFTYTASDGADDSAPAAVEVTVTGLNDAPFCADTGLTTNEDTAGSTAASCADVDDEPLTITVTQPTKGVAAFSSPSLTFDPNGQYEDLDTGDTDTANGNFTYKAHDGTVDSNVANVAVTVTGVNDAPTCENVTLTVSEDGPPGSTSPDCDDPEGDALTYSVGLAATGVSGVAGASLTYDPNGQFEQLDDGETGNDSFTYRANDGDADSNAANVAVTIQGANDAPVCQDVTLTTSEDTPASTPASCTDVDVEPLTISATQPTKGVAGYSNPNLTFDPNGQYESLDTGETDETNGDFTYKANDGTADSNVASVAATVSGVNDAPVCAAVSLPTNEDTVGTTAPSCTDVDDPAASLTYTVTAPTKGLSSFASPNLRFDPNGQYEGLDTGEQDTTNGDFMYRADDGEALSAPSDVSVTVSGVNDAPVCQNVEVSTNEDTIGTVAASCTDVDDEPLTISVTQPTKGVSSYLAPSLRFNPNGQYESLNTGDSDTANGDFTYNANDGTIDSNVADVAVTVTGVNDAPVLTVTPASVSAQYSDPIASVGISATDVDTPGTGLTFAIKDAPGCSVVTALPGDLVMTDNPGNATLPGSRTAAITGNVTVAPGAYPRCVEVTDGGGGRDTETLGVTVTKEDADATYTGDMLAFTAPGGSAANVVLRATIRDSSLFTGDAHPGDIRNATVEFREGTTPLCTLLTSPLPLLAPPDTRTATVECSKSFGLGEHTIAIYVNGYYVGAGSGVVEVSQPDGSFITGGGYIVISASSPAGQYAADPGSRMNYGFNVKYNKNKTSLQGHLNVIFRRTSGGVLRSYQIKANSMESLGIAYRNGSGACAGPVSSSCWGVATFRSKANLADVTNPAAPVSLGGNLTVQVTLTDKGEPGKSDSIGVTLWQGSTLLFSSDWNGSQTLEKVVAGGNLVVH